MIVLNEINKSLYRFQYHCQVVDFSKHPRKTYGKTERDSDEVLKNSQAKNISKIS